MEKPIFNAIYTLVRKIPKGKVATYGQIASYIPNCHARIVGYAMSSAPEDVPWQRVINAEGKISQRNSLTPSPQQKILEAEGIVFNTNGKTDLTTFRCSEADLKLF